jgi:hypothetical protein
MCRWAPRNGAISRFKEKLLALGDPMDLRIQIFSILVLIACSLSGCDKGHDDEVITPPIAGLDRLISTESCKVRLMSGKILTRQMDSPDKDTEFATITLEFKNDLTVLLSSDTEFCLTKRDDVYCRPYPSSVVPLTYVKGQNVLLLMRGDHLTPWAYVSMKNEKEADLVSTSDVWDFLPRDKKMPLRIESCSGGKKQ